MPSSESGSPRRIKLDPTLKFPTLLSSFRTSVAIYQSPQSYVPGNMKLHHSFSQNMYLLVLSLFPLTTLLYCDLIISITQDTDHKARCQYNTDSRFLWKRLLSVHKHSLLSSIYTLYIVWDSRLPLPLYLTTKRIISYLRCH